MRVRGIRRVEAQGDGMVPKGLRLGGGQGQGIGWLVGATAFLACVMLVTVAGVLLQQVEMQDQMKEMKVRLLGIPSLDMSLRRMEIEQQGQRETSQQQHDAVLSRLENLSREIGTLRGGSRATRIPAPPPR